MLGLRVAPAIEVPPSFGEVRPAVIDVPPSGERRPAVMLVPPSGLARPGRAMDVPPSGLALPVGAGAGAGASPSEAGVSSAAAFRRSRAAAAFGRVIVKLCSRQAILASRRWRRRVAPRFGRAALPHNALCCSGSGASGAFGLAVSLRIAALVGRQYSHSAVTPGKRSYSLFADLDLGNIAR